MKYIEDLVEQFGFNRIHVSNFDEKISQSLANQIMGGKAFTHKQAEIALRLVKKYRNQFHKMGVQNVDVMIETPVYRYALRTIDQSKSVYVDPTTKKFVVKFPFNQNLVTLLRSLNQKEKLTKAEWDPDGKYWTLEPNELSLSFISEHLADDFTLDETIKGYIEQINMIRENFESYIPTLIKDGLVYKFVNVKTDFETTDLVTALAESAKLGVSVYDDAVAHELKERVAINPLSKIYEKSSNQKFFIDKSKYSRHQVLHLVKEMNVNTAIFVDENISAESMEKWIADLTEIGVSLEDVGVFFRRKNDKDGIEFNKVIKDFGLNKEATANPKWIFLSSKFPKSLIKSELNIDVCLFVNRYVASHYSVINTIKNSVFTLHYNEHKTAEADIVNL